MRLLFNLLTAIVAAKVLALGIFFFLKSEPVDFVRVDNSPIYKNYRFENLFYEKKKVTPKQEIVAEFTIKNITLKAIYEAGDASIIIIEEKAKTKLLSIGDVYKKYKLIGVQKEKAIFEKAHKTYSLSMKAAKERAYSIEKASKEPDVTKEVSITKSKINRYKNNISAILKEISITHFKRNGVLVGYKIIGIKKGGDFSKLGLKVGDIIRSVNDKRLKTDADAFYFYKNLDKFDSMKLTVLRGEKEINIEFDVKE